MHDLDRPTDPQRFDDGDVESEAWQAALDAEDRFLYDLADRFDAGEELTLAEQQYLLRYGGVEEETADALRAGIDHDLALSTTPVAQTEPDDDAYGL